MPAVKTVLRLPLGTVAVQMKETLLKALIIAVLLSFLVGCGGGGNGSDEVAMPDDKVMKLVSDPRIERLGGIVERTEVMLTPGVHVRYSVSVLHETTADSLLQTVICEETTCSGAGITLTLESTLLTDLIDPDIDISVGEAALQTQEDGFDTAFVRGELDASDVGVLLPEIALVEIPQGLGYGLWGEHGMAGMVMADGPFSGRVADVPFSGDMQVVMPFAFGDVSGTNPEGVGSATWSGIAEVVAIRTLRRQQGIATLTIEDLARPAISVGIEVGGNPIGKSGWTDMPLASGHFVFGGPGDDYVEGHLHGASHSEAYGVFDTDNFTGAFGAKLHAQNE